MHKAKSIILAVVLGAALLSGCGPRRNTTPCPLTRAETTIGWDAKSLDDAFQFACELGSTTLIVATNGEVVRAMGDLATPHRVHSVRKALLSALVGQHTGTGPKQINLESTLAELGIDDEPHPLTKHRRRQRFVT